MEQNLKWAKVCSSKHVLMMIKSYSNFLSTILFNENFWIIMQCSTFFGTKFYLIFSNSIFVIWERIFRRKSDCQFLTPLDKNLFLEKFGHMFKVSLQWINSYLSKMRPDRTNHCALKSSLSQDFHKLIQCNIPIQC